MIKKTLRVFSVAKGEYPPTDRHVLGWRSKHLKNKASRRRHVFGPKSVFFDKKTKQFWDGYALASIEYWCFWDDLEVPL